MQFALLDLNFDGVLNLAEIQALLNDSGTGASNLFSKMDRNKDGQVTEEEWSKFMRQLNKSKGTAVVQQLNGHLHKNAVTLKTAQYERAKKLAAEEDKLESVPPLAHLSQ